MEDGSHPNGPPQLPLEQHPLHGYARALLALDAARIPYLVGGGLALAQYGRRRATKDLDIFLMPLDAERAMNALATAGFTTLDSDAPWLRKAQMDGVFIDLILHSSGPIDLTPEEVERGLPVVIEGVQMRIFAPEDLLIRKMYTLREGGPDWVDAYSIIEANASHLRWDLVERDSLDPRLQAAFLLTASTAVPGRIPAHVIERHIIRAQSIIREQALNPNGSAAPGRALPPPDRAIRT
jgi:hypothetical protein